MSVLRAFLLVSIIATAILSFLMQYTCDICHIDYKSRSSLSSHVTRSHKIATSCNKTNTGTSACVFCDTCNMWMEKQFHPRHALNCGSANKKAKRNHHLAPEVSAVIDDTCNDSSSDLEMGHPLTPVAYPPHEDWINDRDDGKHLMEDDLSGMVFVIKIRACCQLRLE